MIDDHVPDVVYTQIMLERSGRYGPVGHLDSGEAALELFEAYETARLHHPWFPPLVILLDINMPRMDGFEFLERFAEIADALARRGEVPSVIVMLTSSTAERDRRRVAAYGTVKQFISKPITVDAARQLADTLGFA